MNVVIHYSSHYHYEKRVSFSPHSARVFPRTGATVQCHTLDFHTNDGADIQIRRDLFDNEFALCFYPAIEDSELRFEARFELASKPRNPFHFLLDSHAIAVPFDYTPSERRILAPAMAPEPGEEGFRLPFWQLPAAPTTPTVEALASLTKAVFDNIAYERRDTGSARSPHQTLNLRSGACRDTSLLMAAALRALGLAARLASGYLCESPEPASGRPNRAEGAFHAWVETFLPGAGWVGLDGTNGIFCDHTFITTAVGLSPEDVTPISGSYYGRDKVASSMQSSIEIENQAIP